jgi:membrane-bound lytic murein transglycosylase F
LAAAAAALLLVLLTACAAPPEDTLRRIKETGRIIVISDNSAHTFFIYRDQPMGFEYDLARALARELGVELEIITPGWDDMIDSLQSGRGDLIAAGLTITAQRKQHVDFSDAYLSVQQQVIVHRDNRAIKDLQDLAGFEIHVRAQTSYQERLEELQQEGLDLRVVLHPNVPTEELIRRVAQKKFEATVSDSNIALFNRRYYPDVRIAFPIEEPQSLGWAVRKGDRRFLKTVNAFFKKIQEDGTFGKIYERYYAGTEIFDYVDLKKFHRRLETRLPKYIAPIRKEAKRHGFDWRLIAAVIYQESHFDPQAKSFTGVRGLMQVTRRTAAEMGISDRTDPVQSIRAGVRYLSTLYDRFDKIESQRDRLLFTLASYNVGYGHVRDAQKIAAKKGWDPRKWSSLKQTLPLLRLPEYYRETKYGYARGTEPVRYIDRVLLYYDIIRREAHDS